MQWLGMCQVQVAGAVESATVAVCADLALGWCVVNLTLPTLPEFPEGYVPPEAEITEKFPPQCSF